MQEPLPLMSDGRQVPHELIGTTLEFMIVPVVGCSIAGMARDFACRTAMANGADVLFFFDYDMEFEPGIFTTMLMNNVPVQAALAFTGREPITPVVYKFDHWEKDGAIHFNSEVVWDYPKNRLFQVDAFGAGVMMLRREALEKIPQPWFYSAAAGDSIGEDVLFCWKAHKAGVPVYVDSRCKANHKPTFNSKWHNEEEYERSRAHRSNPNVEQPPATHGHVAVPNEEHGLSGEDPCC